MREAAATHRTALTVVALAVAARRRRLQLDPRRPPARPTTTTTHLATTTTTSGPAGTWSKAIPVAPGANLSVVSCPSAGTCVVGIDQRADLPARTSTRSNALGPAVPVALAPGRLLPLVRQRRLLRRRTQPEPGRARTTGRRGSPRPPSRPRRASRPSTAPGPPSASPSTARATRSPTTAAGWSGNLGAWGAANQISCVSPVLLRRRRGRALGVQRPHLDPAQRRRHPGPAQLGLLRLDHVLRHSSTAAATS